MLGTSADTCIQQVTVPVRTPGKPAVYLAGNGLRDPLKTGVEAVEI